MFFEPEVEQMKREDLEKLQEERLRKIVRYCYENVPFYRRKFKEKGLEPDDIRGLDDIGKLPFTTKDDLREHYPFGMIAVPRSKIVRFHASSGTTGKPTIVAYTKRDIENWAELMARVLTCVGITKEDTMQLIYNYAFFTGGLGFHYGAEKIGAAVIPSGVGNTKKQILTMRDLEVTAFSSTPSYALYLAEYAEKEMGIDVRKLKLRIGIFGAEPWSEATRKKIENAFEIEAFDNYGLSELCGPGVSVECEEKNGLHVWSDHFLVEVVDPETGERLDEGKEGELVFTTLMKEAMPLLRYRTRDISVIYPDECSCGRTHVKIAKIRGRTDDMLIIRGVNVFPSQIEHVLMQIPEVGENYQIIVDRDILDKLLVRVEVTEKVFSDKLKDLLALEKKIERELKEVLNVSAKVELVSPGSIPRTPGKAKRIIDLRKDKI